MSTEDNKELARRFVQEVMVGQDAAAADEIVAEGFTPHSWGEVPPGREALKVAMERVSAGLSDERMDIKDVIAEGDKVAIRLNSSARHTGDFMGMPATGRSYEIGEMHILRIRDGQVVEHWAQTDMAGLMKQLGADSKAG